VEGGRKKGPSEETEKRSEKCVGPGEVEGMLKKVMELIAQKLSGGVGVERGGEKEDT